MRHFVGLHHGFIAFVDQIALYAPDIRIPVASIAYAEIKTPNEADTVEPISIKNRSVVRKLACAFLRSALVTLVAVLLVIICFVLA